jgi:hypothetical protein
MRALFRLLPIALLLGALLAAAGPAAASSGSKPKDPKIDVAVKIDRFKATGKDTVAHGTITGTLTDLQGEKTTVKEPVTVQVQAAAGGCKILTLDLDQLDLTLLGLNVHLDKVNLAVTGQKNAGVLGRLFCKLADTKVKARVAAARALTARVSRKPMRMLTLSAPITPKVTSAQAAPATCQVLSLIVGPLNLQLLGLVVDLNKVKLDITATRGQGALGDLFCQLADNNTSGGSSSGTTTAKPVTPGRE